MLIKINWFSGSTFPPPPCWEVIQSNPGGLITLRKSQANKMFWNGNSKPRFPLLTINNIGVLTISNSGEGQEFDFSRNHCCPSVVDQPVAVFIWNICTIVVVNNFIWNMFLHNCNCQHHRRQIMSRHRSWRSGWKVVIDDTCCPWCIDHWLLVQPSADFMNKSHDHENGNPYMPWEFHMFSAILQIILIEGLLLTSTLMHRPLVFFSTLCKLR